MKSFLELKKEALTLMVDGRKIAGEFGFLTSQKAIEESINDFVKKELMIVTVGEMKRGKSSLLNALLNETDIFPVDANVATNTVTIVKYGVNGKFEVIMERRRKLDRKDSEAIKNEYGNLNGTIMDMEYVTEHYVEEISRDRIADYVSEQKNPNNYKNVKVLNITLNNPLLKEGVVFVDTPGVGSLNIAHAETTYGFLPNADILLFVSDALSGLTETEIDFLKRGYKYCSNIIYPLTKMDLKPAFQDIVDDNRKKIHDALGIANEEIHILPVSNIAKQRYMATGNQMMYTNSGFPALEKAIWTCIAQRRFEIQITPFLLKVCDELQKIQDSVTTQFQLLNKSKEKQKEMLAELDRQVEKLKKMKLQNTAWRSDLNLFSQLLPNEISPRTKEIELAAGNILSSEVNRLGARIVDPKVYQDIYQQINSTISSGLLDVVDMISEKVNDKVWQVNQELGLHLDVNREALENIGFTPNDTLTITFPPRKKLDKVQKAGEVVGRTSMAGGRIGMIVGGILGLGLAVVAGPALLAAQLGLTAIGAITSAVAATGAIGGAAGSMLGGAKGCIDAVRNHHEVDIPVVVKAFQNHIISSMALVNSIIQIEVRKIGNGLSNSFEEKISARADEINDNISQLRANSNAAEYEIPQKLAELNKRHETLESYFGKIDTYMKAAKDTAAIGTAIPVTNHPIQVPDAAKKPASTETTTAPKEAPVKEETASSKKQSQGYAFLDE